ncbi:MAG: hypothetical protein M0Q92_07710 [Methanoregula sp.]|jgi:hypothetical protein|nr:hypothetical protein [Methanoregula sp.]
MKTQEKQSVFCNPHPTRTCRKCGSVYDTGLPEGEKPGEELCPVCRERYVRSCRECRRPYRTDTVASSLGLCSACYYAIYDDDD